MSTFSLPVGVTPSELIRQVETLEDTERVSGFGWRRFTSTYRSLQAYAHEKYGLVVKKPNCILEPRTPSSVRVPTLYLKNGWVIQPLVKKVKLRKACDTIAAQLVQARAQKIYPDLHTGNVGWYHGKPVMFDW